MTSPPQSFNQLLALLPSMEFELVRPHTRIVPLILGEILVEAGRELPLTYFPNSGIISSIVTLMNGETVEVGMIGRDGVYGAALALNGSMSPTSAVVHFPGTATVIQSSQFPHVYAQSEALRAIVDQQQWIVCVQAEQLAACNAVHDVLSRLSRKLLQMRDLVHNDTLPVTQEALARMLGVRRNSIALAAGALQKAGVIEYIRGQIRIVDHQSLNYRSCECYEANKIHAGRSKGVIT